MHPIGHCTLLADCVSKLNRNERARRKGATSQASLIHSERDIFDYFISTRITGKIAELLMQVIQDPLHYQGEKCNKFWQIFRILYSFCTSNNDSKFISFLEPLVAQHTDIKLSFGEFFRNFNDSFFLVRL